MIGLAGLCGMALMVAYGTLVAIDNAVTAEAVRRRLEAGSLMQANLPPAVADADNAAPLQAGGRGDARVVGRTRR